MTHSNPEALTYSFASLMSTAVDERRALNLPERYKVDDILESLFRSNKETYYSCYASYAALTGNIKGLDDCSNYFFSMGKKSLSVEAIQCIFALNNAAYFEKIYSVLSPYDVKAEKVPELINIFINSAVLTFNFEVAENLISQLDPEVDYISDDQLESAKTIFEAAKIFYFSHPLEKREDVRSYLRALLKLHREKITQKIYKVAGPSIIRPEFFADEGVMFLNIAIEYVSDDIDYALDLENYFYEILRPSKCNVDVDVQCSIIYNVLPVGIKDSLPFTERVIEVGVSR